MSISKGIEFFPLDVDIFSDDKLEYVIAKHGNESEIIIVRLLCKIYRNGYYTNWTDDDPMLLSGKINKLIPADKIQQIVNELIERNFFNKSMFKKHKILTSKAIQERYKYATARRKNISIDSYNCLKNVNNKPKDDDNNEENDNKSEKKEGNNQQTILDDTILDNTKEEYPHPLMKFVADTYPKTLAKISEQFTEKNCINLLDPLGKYACSQDEIKELLLQMHNKYEKIKKNKTLFGTFLTFLDNKRTNFGRNQL